MPITRRQFLTTTAALGGVGLSTSAYAGIIEPGFLIMDTE